MDSIASYVYSSDSDDDFSGNGEKLVQTGLGKKIKPSDSQQGVHNWNNLGKEEEQTLAASDNSLFKDSSTTIPNTITNAVSTVCNNSCQQPNTVMYKEFQMTRGAINSLPTKEIVKPYVPKSKRAKLTKESENIDKTVQSSLSLPVKLSPLFQKAQSFSPTTSLQYQVPRGKVVDFEGHCRCVNRIAWNPCFKDFLLSASMDSVVNVWNVQTTPCCVYQVVSHRQAVKDAQWSHTGFHVLSCGYDKMVRITDINSGKEVCELKHNSFVTVVQYHPSDANVVLSGTSHDGIFAWDVRTQKFICRYKSFFGQVQDLVFLPDGQSFISAAEVLKRNSTDKGIMVWDYKTSTVLSNQVFQEAYTCTALQIHPKDTTFLAQCNVGYIAIFSQNSPYKLNKYKRFEGHQVSGYHIGLDISPDGTLVASGSADGSVFIYNYRTSNTLKHFASHSYPCMDVAWSPIAPSLLASCDWNGRIILHK